VETNLEELAEQAERWVRVNRRALFIGASIIFAVWILSLIKEVALLLLVSYLVAVLINPGVKRLHKKGLSRELGTITILLFGLLTIALILFVLLPPVIAQYADLISYLPHYAEKLTSRMGKVSGKYGVGSSGNSAALVAWIKEKATHLEPENLGEAAEGLLAFLLQGYSLTLTILNLALLPFFIFYISADLEKIHNFAGDFFPDETRGKFAKVSNNILGQVYAFFRGQITVSILMAVLYGSGLSIVGVTNGMAIGFLAGLLNVVPYLGLIIGIILSLSSMLMTDPTWGHIFSVLGVFAVVQIIEVTFLTPRIMGDKTGIHPLGIILSLLIGGELMGIFGLIVAIPAAAAIKILFKFIWEEVKESRRRIVLPDAAELAAVTAGTAPTTTTTTTTIIETSIIS
jgi:predicted PurR-regulated permease PerM